MVPVIDIAAVAFPPLLKVRPVVCARVNVPLVTEMVEVRLPPSASAILIVVPAPAEKVMVLSSATVRAEGTVLIGAAISASYPAMA